MSEPTSPHKYSHLAEVLAQLILENEPETKEELDDRVRKMGYEPSDLAAKIRFRINQIIDDSPLNWRNKGDQIEAEQKKLSQFKVGASKTIDDLISEIQHLLRGLGGRVALHYRNQDLSKQSRSDLESLLAELRYQTSQNSDVSDDDKA